MKKRQKERKAPDLYSEVKSWVQCNVTILVIAIILALFEPALLLAVGMLFAFLLVACTVKVITCYMGDDHRFTMAYLYMWIVCAAEILILFVAGIVGMFRSMDSL